MKRLFVLLALVLVAACGPKLPPDTPVTGKIAVRGNQVVQALRATLPEIKKNVCASGAPATAVPTCLKPEEAITVVSYIDKALEGAESLGQTLLVVEDAKDAGARAAGMEKARAYLVSIQSAIASAQVSPDNEGARTSLVQLLGNVSALLFTISLF